METSGRFVKVANRIAEAFNAENFTGVESDFSRAMLEAVPLERLAQVSRELMAQYGRIRGLDARPLPEAETAVLTVRLERGVLDMVLTLDGRDRVIGLRFVPHTPAPPPPERNATRLSLPFKGAWFIAWGGDTRELNYHHDTPSQRFAFDVVAVDEGGQTHAGGGTANEDYYAFGREVLAPAEGLVTDVIGGVRDNEPGFMNPYSALGNAVFIRHAEREVSVLAHLKLGGTEVKVGDHVRAGQVVGLCGNSGNSSEPHLHYHLQDGALIQEAVGIKCHFLRVLVMKEGETEERADYSPLKGEIVGSE